MPDQEVRWRITAGPAEWVGTEASDSYSVTFVVDAPTAAVFRAINHVRGWPDAFAS